MSAESLVTISVCESIELLRAELFEAGATRVDVGERDAEVAFPSEKGEAVGRVFRAWGYFVSRVHLSNVRAVMKSGTFVAKNPFREAIEAFPGTEFAASSRVEASRPKRPAIAKRKKQGGE